MRVPTGLLHTPMATPTVYPAAERNKQAILETLRHILSRYFPSRFQETTSQPLRLLEIGKR